MPTLTAIIAVSALPPAVGVKVTAMVHCEAGKTVLPQVPPVTAKSPAFAPLKLSLKDSENGDRLVTVSFRAFDAFVSVPCASVAGMTVAGIVGPVLSATV